jgi:hypothetical protein
LKEPDLEQDWRFHCYGEPKPERKPFQLLFKNIQELEILHNSQESPNSEHWFFLYPSVSSFVLWWFTCNRVCEIFTSLEEPAMLRVREPRCSIYNSFLYASVSSFVLWCSLAIEFVRFLHRRRSPPCCVLESRVVLFTTLFFTLRFLLSFCGVHLQTSLSDFYIVRGAHHICCVLESRVVLFTSCSVGWVIATQSSQRIELNTFASFRSMLGSSGVRTRCFFEWVSGEGGSCRYLLTFHFPCFTDTMP